MTAGVQQARAGREVNPSGLTAPQARYYYDTARFGLGNGGHRFGDKLNDEERSDLIEYLKTL